MSRSFISILPHESFIYSEQIVYTSREQQNNFHFCPDGKERLQQCIKIPMLFSEKVDRKKRKNYYTCVSKDYLDTVCPEL